MRNLTKYKEYLKTQDKSELIAEGMYVTSWFSQMKIDLDSAIKNNDKNKEKHVLEVIQNLRDQLKLIEEEEMIKDPKGAKEFQEWKAKMHKEGNLNTFIYPDDA